MEASPTRLGNKFRGRVFGFAVQCRPFHPMGFGEVAEIIVRGLAAPRCAMSIQSPNVTGHKSGLFLFQPGLERAAGFIVSRSMGLGTQHPYRAKFRNRTNGQGLAFHPVFDDLMVRMTFVQACHYDRNIQKIIQGKFSMASRVSSTVTGGPPRTTKTP